MKKNDLNKWRDIVHYLISRWNIVKISVILKLICWFNAIPVRLVCMEWARVMKNILKIKKHE